MQQQALLKQHNHSCLYCRCEYTTKIEVVSRFCSCTCRNKYNRLKERNKSESHQPKIKKNKDYGVILNSNDHLTTPVIEYQSNQKKIIAKSRRTTDMQLVEITPRTWVMVDTGKDKVKVQAHVIKYLNDNNAQI